MNLRFCDVEAFSSCSAFGKFIVSLLGFDDLIGGND